MNQRMKSDEKYQDNGGPCGSGDLRGGSFGGAGGSLGGSGGVTGAAGTAAGTGPWQPIQQRAVQAVVALSIATSSAVLTAWVAASPMTVRVADVSLVPGTSTDSASAINARSTAESAFTQATLAAAISGGQQLLPELSC